MKIFSTGIFILVLNYLAVFQYINLNHFKFFNSFRSIENEGELKILKNYFDLTNCLPIGFVMDGSVDYTKYIQKGIDENENVLMPNFPLLINEDGIKAKSNSKIVFQEKSVLIMKPNSLPYYSILKIFDVTNVVINSPKIIGERNQHKGSKGEWGFGVHIKGSKNIEIFALSVSNCWGDGLYIGGDEANTCDNIKIVNAKIDSCRRNGISITDGKNIQILNPKISNTYGTSPMAAIDIEPNNSNATIDNIVINNPVSVDNKGFGILIALGELPAKESKTVRIKIKNHIDNNSKIAFCLADFRGDYHNKTQLAGLIEINNPKWFGNAQTLLTGRYNFAPKTQFKNIEIYRNGLKSKEDILKLKKQFSKTKNLEIN